MAPRAPKRPVVTDSSGDVFADLGLEVKGQDAWKVAIAMAITSTITRGKLTQAEVGRIIGIDQPKVSNLTRGRLEGFSLDRLVYFLLMLGYDIDVHLTRQLSPSRKGQVRVHNVAMAM